MITHILVYILSLQVCVDMIKASNKPCPYCRGEQFFTLLNKEKKGVILGLRVYCSNKGTGCTWTGELGDANRHLESRL